MWRTLNSMSLFECLKLIVVTKTLVMNIKVKRIKMNDRDIIISKRNIWIFKEDLI